MRLGEAECLAQDQEWRQKQALELVLNTKTSALRFDTTLPAKERKGKGPAAELSQVWTYLSSPHETLLKRTFPKLLRPPQLCISEHRTRETWI